MELTPFLLILVAVVGWGVGDVFARKALFGARAETVLTVIVAVVALSVGTAGLAFEGVGAFWPVGARFLALTALMAILSWASGVLLQFHALRLGWRRHRLSTPQHGAVSRHRNGCPARRGAAQRGDARRRGARGRGRGFRGRRPPAGAALNADRRAVLLDNQARAGILLALLAAASFAATGFVANELVDDGAPGLVVGFYEALFGLAFVVSINLPPEAPRDETAPCAVGVSHAVGAFGKRGLRGRNGRLLHCAEQHRLQPRRANPRGDATGVVRRGAGHPARTRTHHSAERWQERR